MNLTVLTYITYLIISITLTAWVAQTLFRNGRIFLVDCFLGKEDLADSVNHLLLVGFYLVNVGFVALFLRIGIDIGTVRGVLEVLSGKLGVVLLVLGVMHFGNIFVFTKLRRRGMRRHDPPPIEPTARVDAPKLG